MAICNLQIWKLFKDPFVWRPLLIFLGPLPILVLLWTFAILTFTEPRALRYSLAILVQNHSQSATLITSIFATMIASGISYLFSLAVRYVISIRLATTPTALDTLSSAAHIAQQSFWFHDPRVIRTWIVLFAYTVTAVQTSSLIAFLTVHEIQFSYGLTGLTLNITDPRVWEPLNGTLPSEVSQRLFSPFFQGYMIDAMMVNATSTFSYSPYSFLGSSGGIYPAPFSLQNPAYYQVPFNADTVVAANSIDVTKSKYLTLPFNKSMQLTQPGFTADVDCRFMDPHDKMTYRPTLSSKVIDTAGLAMVRLNVTCPNTSPAITQAGPVVHNASGTIMGGLMLGVPCPVPLTNSYDIVIWRTSYYNDPNNQSNSWTTCNITPRLTFVNVTYVPSTQNLLTPEAVTVSAPLNKTDDVSLWGRIAIDMLLYYMILGQGPEINNMENAWFISPGPIPDISTEEAMNTYLRAGIEFSAMLIRDTLKFSMYHPSFLSQLALNNSAYTPIQGTSFGMTYGWYQTSWLLLLPTMVIIVATYGFLTYGVIYVRKHRDCVHAEDLSLDPTDIVHIIAAQAPESRRDELRSFSHGSTSYMRQTVVQIQSKEGVRVFVVSRRSTHTGNPRCPSEPSIEGAHELDDLASEPDELAGSTANSAPYVSSSRVGENVVYSLVSEALEEPDSRFSSETGYRPHQAQTRG